MPSPNTETVGTAEAFEAALSSLEARVERVVEVRSALVAALLTVTARLVSLIDSGDCGFWDSNGEEAVIAARAALSLANGEAV